MFLLYFFFLNKTVIYIQLFQNRLACFTWYWTPFSCTCDSLQAIMHQWQWITFNTLNHRKRAVTSHLERYQSNLWWLDGWASWQRTQTRQGQGPVTSLLPWSMFPQEIKQHNCAVYMYVVSAAKHHKPIPVYITCNHSHLYYMCAQDTHPSAMKVVCKFTQHSIKLARYKHR